MKEKVFINSKHVGSIVCPECKKRREKDFSAVKNLNNSNGFKCKCPCGHTFSIVLERRRYERKTTDLTGSYLHDKTKTRGLVSIKNLSKSGAALELNTKQMIPKGDKLVLKFNLDNARKTYLCKEAVIKKSDGSTVGLEFVDDISDDGLNIYFEQGVAPAV